MRAIRWGAVALASVLISSAAMAEEAAGEWHGAIEAGGATLRLAVHIKKTGDAYSGTVDSLDQGVNGLALANIISTAKP